MKSCYITADLASIHRVARLRAVLVGRGINVVIPSELSLAPDPADLLRQTISKADWIIGVVTKDTANAAVFFEFGIAIGMNKRHLLLVEPGSEVPFSLENILQLRAAPENGEAIKFAVQQMLAAPRPKKHRAYRRDTYRALGAESDRLLALLDHVATFRPPLGLESLVESALKAGGARTIATSFTTAEISRYDIAVWVDELEAYVGNPLPIEVQYSFPSATVVEEVIRRFKGGTTPWALVLYVNDTPETSELWRQLPATILHMRVRELLERMRTDTFPDIVRSLRNRVVHGVSA